MSGWGEAPLVGDIDDASSVLHELRHLGTRLIIDDFGVGYASLRYLHKLPFDVLKIDREFVKPLSDPEADLTIVATIISMAHNLGMSVIAEGVENRRQAGTLAELGCDSAQGYLFGHPSPDPFRLQR
ncbi:MAG: EAL domain-containing protein [Acidimicrobiales bacterium]